MQKGNIIKEICLKLLEDKKEEGEAFAREKYPFTSYAVEKRKYTVLQQTQVFLRDGFIDRYIPEKDYYFREYYWYCCYTDRDGKILR